jgi:hypothetical protein
MLRPGYRDATDWCKELEAVRNWTLTRELGSLFHKLFNRCVEKFFRALRKTISREQEPFQTINQARPSGTELRCVEPGVT